MPAGMVLGASVVIFSVQHHLLPADSLLAVIGMLGGVFIVPLHALLQHRGQQSAGNASAVQNFAENIAMLLLGLYTLVVSLQVTATAIEVGFGMLFALAIAVLWWFSRGDDRGGGH